MHRPILLALAGLALAAPLAQAQMSTSMTAIVEPPEVALDAGGRLVLEGYITYTADHLAALNTNGIPVVYQVTSAPAWAMASLSPASDVIPIPQVPGPSVSWTATRAFRVVLDGAMEGVDGELGLVEITATAVPTAPQGRAVTAKTMIPLRFEAGEAPCDVVHEAALAPPATEAGAPEEVEPVVVQSSAATPLAMPLAAVAGFGAVGAGAGLVLRKRLR